MRIKPRLRYLFRRYPRSARIAQILGLAALWQFGQTVSALSGLPIPGAVIALVTLLGLLLSGVIPAWLIARGADWLIAELLLFFIPAVMILPRYAGLLLEELLPLAAIVAVGTLLAMAGSALAVDLVWRLGVRRGG